MVGWEPLNQPPSKLGGRNRQQMEGLLKRKLGVRRKGRR